MTAEPDTNPYPIVGDEGFYVFARFVGADRQTTWRCWTGPRGGNPASTAPYDHPAVAWFATRAGAKAALRAVFGTVAEARAWGLEVAPVAVVRAHHRTHEE